MRSQARPPRIVSFRCRSTNCFVVESATNRGLLAIDAGWPCSFGEYARAMKSVGRDVRRLGWVFVTHFHMDHAGLMGEFIDRDIRCLVFENQENAIDPMEKMILRTYKAYKPIDKTRLIKIQTRDSRNYLDEIGMGGEVLITPGHSSDSVTYVSDAGEAIIGDLNLPELIMPGDPAGLKSWELIRSKGVQHVYPSHAPAFDVPGGGDEG